MVDGEEVDLGRLAAHLREHWPAWQEAPLTLERFPGGFSNLTYLVRLGGRELVLRRPPLGNTVKTAHDMGREYRVLAGLAPVYPLAPRPLYACEDPSVLGAPFFLMERRRGLTLRREPPPGLELAPEMLGRLSEAFADALADLHAVDVRAGELAALGRPEGYVRRQVEGWSERYLRAAGEPRPALSRLITWLADQRPEGEGAALVHNDFKLDNLLLDPSDPARIVAVLDWEMATVGDPWLDLGTSLAYWVEAADPEWLQPLAMGPTAWPGSLSRRELAARYAERRGQAAPGLAYYYLFGLLKVAAIAEQIHARYRRGLTRDPRFAHLDGLIGLLARQAERVLASGKV